MSSPFIYFTDAVLRGPTIGCMLMCMASALVGVIVFLRKQSLLGEALSHAAYPGVILGIIFASLFNSDPYEGQSINLMVMGGAFFTAIVGLWCIHLLERSLNVRSDSALCFILSAFFGIGLTMASQIQFTHTAFYRQAQAYFYGQAATMTDIHILIYGILAAFLSMIIVIFYKEIRILTFDRDYARSIGVNAQTIDGLIFILIVLAVVIGIRSVGVVLMSSMLIAPAAAARQYSNRLSSIFIIAAFFGLASGFLGNYLSIEMTHLILTSTFNFSLPTGPMIVIVASLICFFSLFFAPERGLCIRLIRIARFRYRCLCENLLKAIWRYGADKEIPFETIEKHQSVSPLYLRFILGRLIRYGWVQRTSRGYLLTADGVQWATRIVRLHRLWEVYLVEFLGVGAERVHYSAEEMEHIITPELERQLTLLLKNPKHDPHDQPIPPAR